MDFTYTFFNIYIYHTTYYFVYICTVKFIYKQFKYYIMKQIIVLVERETHNPQKPFLKLFEKIVTLPSGIFFPYDKVSESLAFLFGNLNRDLVISFRLSTYE